MKKILNTIFALFLMLNSFAQNQSLASVLQRAKTENKLIFIDCYFTGCIPCIQMDENVFPNKAVKAEMEKNFLILKVDIFKDKLGDTLKVQHILNGFPTFLILNADGKLISSTSGYKDPGNLINLFKDAVQKVAENKTLGGYSSQYKANNYPSFYVEFCKTRKGITPAVLANYSDTLKNFKTEYALLPYLAARYADEKAIDIILSDYKSFAALYGEDVLQPVVDYGLNYRLKKQLESNINDQAFENFLKENKKYFGEKQWKIALQGLSTKYFLGMKKDTTAYLKFAVKNPVLYQYYFTSLYNELLAKKGLTQERNQLLCKWADAIVTEDSGLEFMKTAALIYKNANDENGYNRFLKMAIAYGKKYQMQIAEVEKDFKAK